MGKASRKKRDRDKPPLVDQSEAHHYADALTVFDLAAPGPVSEISDIRINGQPITEAMILHHQRDTSIGCSDCVKVK